MVEFYIDSSGLKRYKNSKRLIYTPDLYLKKFKEC